MTSDNVNTLYQNSPEWRAQMDSIVNAATDKGKAEAAQDQANRSANEAMFKINMSQIDKPNAQTQTSSNDATPIPLPVKYNKGTTTTATNSTPTANSTPAAQPKQNTTPQPTAPAANTAPVTKREPLISSNLDKDSYQNRKDINNRDIIADAKKKGYTTDEADAELKRLGAKTDYSKDMAKAYGPYWNITKEQYWGPKGPTAQQLADSGVSAEKVASLYEGVPEEKKEALYKAYPSLKPAAKPAETTDTSTSETTDTSTSETTENNNSGDNNNSGTPDKKDTSDNDKPIVKATSTPNEDAKNIANGVDGARAAASGAIDKDYIDKMAKQTVADYKGNSAQWKQEEVRPVKNLIQSYADGDIDGKTFVYYMSDWIGTGLRNASHFTPGGNKTAETSKWNTMQQDLQNKQAQLAYDAKSTDTKNMQNIANSGATATQNAANFVGAGGAEKVIEQWGKIMDPALDAKGKIAALKAYANSGISSDTLVNGLLAYNAVNGQGTGQVVSTLAMLVPEEKRSAFIDKATDALSNGVDVATALVGALNSFAQSVATRMKDPFGLHTKETEEQNTYSAGQAALSNGEAIDVKTQNIIKDTYDESADINIEDLKKSMETETSDYAKKSLDAHIEAFKDIKDMNTGVLTESEVASLADDLAVAEFTAATGINPLDQDSKAGNKANKSAAKNRVKQLKKEGVQIYLDKRERSKDLKGAKK